MESKYYTPTIEEFHVGFKFQVLSQDGNRTEDEDWNNQFLGYETIYDFNEESWRENIECYLVLNAIRVKLLDREDIESLGFTYLHETSFLFNTRFHLTSNETYINISDNLYNGTRVIFDGIIKNKSELQKLLIQLGIK